MSKLAVKKAVKKVAKPIKKTTFKVIQGKGHQGQTFSVTMLRPEYSGIDTLNCRIILEPTYNCQLCCLGGVDSLVEELKDTKELKELLQQIYLTVGKNIMLVDVADEDASIFKRWVGSKNIILSKSYKSTNGSHMWIILVDLTKFAPESLI